MNKEIHAHLAQSARTESLLDAAMADFHALYVGKSETAAYRVAWHERRAWNWLKIAMRNAART